MDRLCLQFTRFVDIGRDGKETGESWGYRIYDDTESVYNNTFTSFEELNDVINKHTILQYLWDYHFEFAADVVQRGIYLNDEWIAAEELQEEDSNDKPTCH